ncbi:MAG: hypothetical protein AAF961_17715, partial [Planctomycetota bacterium]
MASINVANLGANFLTARKTTDYVDVSASHPYDVAAKNRADFRPRYLVECDHGRCSAASADADLPSRRLLKGNCMIALRRPPMSLAFIAVALSAVFALSPLPAVGDDLRALRKALAKQEHRYDAGERMLTSKLRSPSYHTTLTKGAVHPTRQSLSYAASCLDAGDPALQSRGFEIIDRVVDLQDAEPGSGTYGIWPWFLEEPLEEMSPPDWNWADFCGVQLIRAVVDHGDAFPPALLQKVEQSIYHAARSIQRRNVRSDYTNIAILGAYVTRMAAELQDLPKLREYAVQRLERLHNYAQKNGTFAEYNSPTYTLVALKELGRMRQR